MAVISPEQLNEAIDRELTLYSKNVIDGIKKQTKKSMDQLVKNTKSTAPVGKRKQHYKDSIKSKKLEDTDNTISYLWYVNGPDYRLSHLIENGHASRNGGRVEGTHFIANALNPILEDYEKTVREICENG